MSSPEKPQDVPPATFKGREYCRECGQYAPDHDLNCPVPHQRLIEGGKRANSSAGEG